MEFTQPVVFFTRQRIARTTVPGSCNSRHTRLPPGPRDQSRSEEDEDHISGFGDVNVFLT